MSTAAHDLLEEIRLIWAEVLDQEDVPVDENFFEAGGDSLLFIVLLERINRLTGREIEAAELFDHATVEAQAEFLAGLAAPQAGEDAAGDAAEGRGRLLARGR
ncbi:acyl carrier protein [Streptomyces aureoversilis]|uniref:Acyl carrier protein n=1 Tax=Streptomyces aureoversilis TaxID=67277 RepID=A0ABV9ZWT8_9ACTN